MEKNHDINMWIIRVGNGNNFRNSRYPFWGVKSGRGNTIKSFIKNNMKTGDVLWFLTSKIHGGKLIGMATYTTFYDRRDEPLVNINTLTNKEQHWIGDEEWNIEIHYSSFYDTERQDICLCIQCAAVIMNYNTFKHKIKEDLYLHYNNFKYYGTPSNKYS